MAETQPRWTAETEELVVRQLFGRRVVGGPEMDWDTAPLSASGRRDWRERAAGVLTTLADAGLLLPPGGETRQEWGVADVADHPGEVWLVESEDRARVRAARLNAIEAYGAARLYRRTVTVHVGPWVPVNDGGGA